MGKLRFTELTPSAEFLDGPYVRHIELKVLETGGRTVKEWLRSVGILRETPVMDPLSPRHQVGRAYVPPALQGRGRWKLVDRQRRKA